MIHDVSIPAALLAGLISFLSPCVLPLVPPYLVYLTGATVEHVANDQAVSASRRAVMASAVIFVLGFSTVFVALGASASLVGGFIHAWSAELSIVAGIVIIVMGLHFLGLTRIDLLMREGRLPIPKPVGLWGAYLMGLAFAFGWTPCIGPILAAILSIAAAFLVKDGLSRGFLPGERMIMLMCWAGLILPIGPIPTIICVILLALAARRAVVWGEGTLMAPRQALKASS